MNFFRNLLALVGVIAIIVSGYGFIKYQSIAAEFDPGAVQTYADLATKLIETKNGAEATIWKVKVDEGLSADDVEEAMKFTANEHNIANVGELPIYKDIKAKTGVEYRYAKIFMFCNSLTAAKMMDYSDAFSAYLPCRITMLEDKQGKLWLISLNMDMMIYGGSPLPKDLKDEAIKVKTIILDIMNRGATGEF